MPTKTYIRKITKKGKYSYFVILPKELIDNFRWKNRQKLTLKSFGKNKILIADWQPKTSKSKKK